MRPVDVSPLTCCFIQRPHFDFTVKDDFGDHLQFSHDLIVREIEECSCHGNDATAVKVMELLSHQSFCLSSRT